MTPEEIESKIKSKALNYFYEHGGTANRREAHGAAGHFEDGARFALHLGREQGIREVIKDLREFIIPDGHPVELKTFYRVFIDDLERRFLGDKKVRK